MFNTQTAEERRSRFSIFRPTFNASVGSVASSDVRHDDVDFCLAQSASVTWR